MKQALFGSDLEELQAAYDDFNSADKLKTYNAIAESGNGGGRDARHMPRIRSNVSRVFNSPQVEAGVMTGLTDRFGLDFKNSPGAAPSAPGAVPSPPDGRKAGSLGGWWHGAGGVGDKAVDAVGEGVAKATDRLANASMGEDGKDLGKKLSTGDFGAFRKVMSGGGARNPAEKSVADGMAQTLPESVIGNMKILFCALA